MKNVIDSSSKRRLLFLRGEGTDYIRTLKVVVDKGNNDFFILIVTIIGTC